MRRMQSLLSQGSRRMVASTFQQYPPGSEQFIFHLSGNGRAWGKRAMKGTIK